MVPNLEPTATLPDHGEAWRLPWEALADGSMRCTGRLVPWQLERRIHLDDSVHVVYEYRNVGDAPHVAYWSAHPLFKFRSGMHLGVPVPRLAEGTSTKLFLPSGSIDRVEVGKVVFRWDPALAPDVAIWVCNGDLGGYRQIAVEPSWTKPAFGPGETYSWWLRIDPL
jgi:hypothetical protein